MLPSPDAPCPCGGSRSFSACCGGAVTGAVWPVTAEALMRSRYTAFAVGAEDHVFRTWHPRTRPVDVDLDPGTEWRSLEIVDVLEGGVDDETGVVEFVARWRDRSGVEGAMRERSRFARRAGRWFYLDGDVSS